MEAIGILFPSGNAARQLSVRKEASKTFNFKLIGQYLNCTLSF